MRGASSRLSSPAMLAAALVLASCSDKVTVLGGLMLELSSQVSQDELKIRVTSADGSKLYFPSDAGATWADYRVPQQVTLPTSLAVASNGDSTAVVVVNASVWLQGQPVAQCTLRRTVPTDHVESIAIGFPECMMQSDGGVTPPSCLGTSQALNCGPGGTDTESCCTSLLVPGGTYFRTYDMNGAAVVPDAATGLADPATVGSFRLDKYVVTVGRFRQFRHAWDQGWTPAAGTGKHTHLNGGMGLVDVGASVGGGGVAYETGWQVSDNDNVAPTDANLACEAAATWTPQPANQETLPINCINWYEAAAFCIWDGGFLPSEAEWGYAAAGGEQQREYPWGWADPGTMNQYAVYGCYYPDGSRHCTGVANFAVVGTPALGAARWGQLDLAGEEYEWVLDWQAPYVTPCADCALLTSQLAGQGEKTMRGGPLNGDASYLLSSLRNAFDPAAQQDGVGDVGIRCARAP